MYLSPFYRVSMASDQNYSYSFSLDVESKYAVSSAMVTFDVYMNPTVVFTIWVNGQRCNTGDYTISTTYAGASQARIRFDCSNIISRTGTYNVILTPSRNTGSVVGWVDAVFSEKTYLASLKGTEYSPDDNGKVFLQLLDNGQQPISNSTCLLNMYYPNNLVWLNGIQMAYLTEGLYYYDFIVPQTRGVYMVSAKCYVPSVNSTIHTASDDFECAGFGCGSGWVKNWTYSGTVAISSSPHDGAFSMIMSGTPVAQRPMNLSVNGTSIFSTFYLKGSGYDAGDYLYFWVCDKVRCTKLGTWTAGFDDGTWYYQSFILNNVTVTNNVTLKFNTTSSVGVADYAYVDDFLMYARTTVNDTLYQVVRGNGEIHITDSGSVSNTVLSLLWNDSRLFDGSAYQYKEGVIKQNITVYSGSISNGFDTTFYYETPLATDCSAIEEFEMYNGSEWVDYMGNIEIMTAGDIENCYLLVNIIVDIGGVYDFRISMDNYQKWEIDWIHDYIINLNATIVAPICQYYGNFYNYTYDIPILTPTNRSNISLLNQCERLLDDVYYEQNLYTESESVDINDLATYLTEERFYFIGFFRTSSLPSYYHTSYILNTALPNTIINSLISALNDTQLLTYILNNVTQVFQVVNGSTSLGINYTLIAQAVWNSTYRTVGVDWATGSLFMWNSSIRTLTFYNESISQSIADCLNSGVCAGWWILNNLANISDEALAVYNIVKVINGTQEYWFANISQEIEIEQAQIVFLQATVEAGFSNIPNLTGFQDMLSILYSMNSTLEYINDTASYYYPLFDGLLVNISQNQQYYYPLFNALLYNILVNQTISFIEFHDALIDIMQNQSYQYDQFEANFSNLTGNEMLIISLLYALNGHGGADPVVQDCTVDDVMPECSDTVRFQCNITDDDIIAGVVFSIGGVNYAPSANGSIYYLDLIYSGGYQSPQIYLWTNVGVTDAHSTKFEYPQSETITYTCVNLQDQLICYGNTEPFLKQKLPFSNRDQIDWVCYLNRSDAECVSEVYYNNDLVQTNPEPKFIDGVGEVTTYHVNGAEEHYFHAWFNRDNLLADIPFNFTVRCNDGYNDLQYSQIVTPTYKDWEGIAHRTVWVKENMSFIILFFVILIFVGIIYKIIRGRQ